MSDDSTTQGLLFPEIFHKPIVAQFDQREGSSDGGALLLKAAKVKAASREFLLLQKAECFLLRKIMKTRDAFDIYGLRQSGVVLNEQLENHLEDTLMGDQIDAAEIAAKISQVDEKRCTELRALLPSEVFESLAKGQFGILREALCDLYRRWL